MEKEIKNCLWGEVQIQYSLAKGVYAVITSSHGGIIVEKQYWNDYLTPLQLKFADFDDAKQWACFEQDCTWAVFADTNRELFSEQSLVFLAPTLTHCFADYLEQKASL